MLLAAPVSYNSRSGTTPSSDVRGKRATPTLVQLTRRRAAHPDATRPLGEASLYGIGVVVVPTSFDVDVATVTLLAVGLIVVIAFGMGWIVRGRRWAGTIRDS